MTDDSQPSPPQIQNRFRTTILRASRLLLDGGGMFGVIPKVVWSRAVEANEENQIEVMHNCVWLQGENGEQYLVEAGSGDKMDEKMTKIFGLDGRTVETELVAAGGTPDDITSVVCSHLHFDHAGGLTRRCREGETPDWTATKPGAASGDDPNVKLTFPNAELVVQKREWVDARANDAVMTRTYYRDHILPFEDDALKLPDGKPRLRLIESQRPFPLNRKPSRDESPKDPLESRMTEVLPGVFTFLVPGHTWGQQAVLWTDEQGRTIVFTPDLIPTVHHVGQAYSLGYDVEPYTAMITKGWFLAEAADRGWVLLLDHEPGNPLQRVKRTEKGWFELEPVAD
ncbi:MAG: MBL fold metallo-hydrolase [Planctomycetota bacterium]